MESTRKNALSLRAAQSCEHAIGPVCKCRCGGAMHGKARVLDTRSLPLDDPHSPSKACPRCKGKGKIPWWNELGQTEIVCPKCRGPGRFLTRKMKDLPLPVA